MQAKRPLVLVGAGEMARVAFEYFTHDSDFRVVAFAVDRAYLTDPAIEGIPVVPYEDLERSHPAQTFWVYTAVPATGLNSLRRRFYLDLKAKGYRFATYVSSRAFVWPNARVGENTFVFEHNVIQPFVSIGANCILWSGNHIGHRTVIEDHVFIASHAVISGYCVIGTGSYVGVNATFNDKIKIGPDTVVGSAALMTKDAEGGLVYVGQPARPIPGKTSKDVAF